MMSNIIRITVTDIETNESSVREIPAGEYVVVTSSPCYVASRSEYPRKGTHVIVIKGQHATLATVEAGSDEHREAYDIEGRRGHSGGRADDDNV